VYARSYCDDADAVVSRRAHVSRSIPNCADGRIRAGEIVSSFERPPIDVCPPLQAIAERKEVEVPQQVARLELDLSDRGEIARRHAKSCLAIA